MMIYGLLDTQIGSYRPLMERANSLVREENNNKIIIIR